MGLTGSITKKDQMVSCLFIFVGQINRLAMKQQTFVSTFYSNLIININKSFIHTSIQFNL